MKPVWTGDMVVDPKKPGHYRYKQAKHAREQVLVIYPGTQDNSKWCYAYNQPGTVMGMLPHDLEGQEYDAYRGFFLVWPGETHPRPLEDSWDDYEEKPEPAKKKVKKKKAASKAPANLDYVPPPVTP